VIVVEPCEDGGNPQDPAAIQHLGGGSYRVFPFSEDGDANYKFALHVRARNTGISPASLALEVDWADQRYTPNRRFGHVRRGTDWEFLPGRVEGSVLRLHWDVPPGESHIGLSPAYGWADYRAFAATLAPTVFRRELLGTSERGRAIEGFHVGSGPRRLLVTARCHPYETAASFGAEGLLQWLAGRGDEQERLLRAASVTVVPMPNPDGVFLGLCKRTAVGGTDLSHDIVGSDDAAARALMGLLDRLRPDAFLDLHGWMHDDEDGLFYYAETLGERFRRAAAGERALADGRWKGMLARPDGSPLRYCVQRFDTLALEVSCRWPGRSVDRMRDIGSAVLRAFATLLLTTAKEER
jgi:hypothetical protein